MSKQTYIRLMIVAVGLLLLSSVAPAQKLNSYVQHNLVSDVRGRAEHFDPKPVGHLLQSNQSVLGVGQRYRRLNAL